MKRSYNKISTYFIENMAIVIPLCITALLFDSLMSLIPRIEGSAINSLYNGDYGQTLKSVITFISLVAFVQVNRFFKRYLVRVFANKLSLKMRTVSLNNLLHKDIAYFESNHAGDILNRNLSDIYDTAEGVRKMTTETFDTFVLLLGYLISMFLMDAKISLFVSISIVLSVVAAQLMKRFVYKSNKAYKEYLSVNKKITLSKLNNELYYRGFGVSQDYYKDYEKSIELLKKKNLTALLFLSGLEPLYLSVAFLGVAFITYFGGLNVINNVYDIGTLSAYLTTFILVAKKAAKVGKIFNAYQGFKVSWARCKEYLGDESKSEFHETIIGNSLTLKDFSYGYEGGFCLPKVNITCNKGDLVGICGRVHVGKSTILKALTGLYPYDGQALMDGIDINKIPLSDTQIIAYCANDVAMFSDTLENNIKLGRSGNMDDALEASRLCEDLDEIGGLNALMSRSTSNISGGQQKRVQMARALFPCAPLLLLDDPFQSVDPNMAEAMMERLKNRKQEIVLFVSNNKNILMAASKIIYLENSKAYVGTYAELMQLNGFNELMEA